jgi:ketosteroid isomerase-like protein
MGMIETHTNLDCQRIVEITEEEVRAIEAGDINAYLSLLSADAVFMPQNATVKAGDELRAWLRDFLERFTIQYRHFAHGETIIRDDLACHTYTCSWIATPKSGGEAKLMFFKGMHVLARQVDGSWRIARSIWNTDPAPSQ